MSLGSFMARQFDCDGKEEWLFLWDIVVTTDRVVGHELHMELSARPSGVFRRSNPFGELVARRATP